MTISLIYQCPQATIDNGPNPPINPLTKLSHSAEQAEAINLRQYVKQTEHHFI